MVPTMYINDPIPDLKGDETLASADLFYPCIDLSDLRRVMRLDGTVTAERLRHAAKSAVIRVQSDLATWRAEQSIEHLSDDQPATYRSAVYAYTAASLTERMASFDSTAEGIRRAEELNNLAQQLMRDGHWAVRDLQGKPRTTVELI